MAGCGLVLVALVGWGAWQGADDVLCTAGRVQQADVIVVLGGEATDRPAKAAQYYHAGIARRILVTGQRRGTDLPNAVATLRDLGVPAAAIAWDTTATSTYGDAMATRSLVQGAEADTVLLVTSWFHARRTLATFRHVIPDVAFVVAPVCHTYRGPQLKQRAAVLVEYLKVGWYVVRYDISVTGVRSEHPSRSQCACA